MNKPHKHAALIKQWADGAVIQYYNIHFDKWMDTYKNTPYWNQDEQYRVKPVTHEFRIALMHQDVIHISRDNINATCMETHRNFVRWLTDWIEYEA